jgi:hypothetical protein
MRRILTVASLALFAFGAVAAHAEAEGSSPSAGRGSLTSQQAAERVYGSLHSNSTLPLKQAGSPFSRAKPSSLTSQQAAERAYGGLRNNSVLPLKRSGSAGD